jgi:DNA-directed RNA polymerase II subunit RPB2
MAVKGDFDCKSQTPQATMNSAAYRNLLELYFDQHDKRQIVYHQISSFNHFMNVEVPQTILRSCPVRVTGSPDLNLTGTTRAAAGTAGTAIRVSVEGADDAAPSASTKPGGPLLQAAAAEPGAPPPREVEVCIEFANVQIRKPTIFENNGAVTPMYPNDARLRNMTYASPIYTDIIATYTMKTPSLIPGQEPTITVSRRTLPHVQVGRIPVMVGSDFCLLSDTPEKTPRELSECSEDIGGYFIIQGGERVIISQERMSENVPFVFRNNKVRGKEVEVIDVKSIGPDNEGAPKSMSVKIMHHAKNAIAPEHIIVTCPRIKAEIPLFIMMRALGVCSDKEIIELICGPGSTGEGNPYAMIFQECMEEASAVTTQEKAHEWLAANLGSGGGSRESYSANTLQPNKPPRTTTIKEVLAEECLPHIGGADMMFEKACYIAFITKKVLDVFKGKVPHDDRDAYPNKKVELPGNLIGNLFRYLFGTKVIKDMKTSLTKEIHNGFWKSSGKVEDIINPSNIYKILKSTIVTIGMKSSLATGNFVGGKMGTKAGISQVMNRLTYLSGISHLRRLSTPIEKTGKLLAPRKLHNTQYGFVCPAETPEGHAVGVVKNLSSTALVSLPISPEPIVAFLYDTLGMKNLGDVSRAALFEGTRILINGAWIGLLMTDAQGAKAAAGALRGAKQRGRIHPHTGITYKSARREIWINTEGGRLLRPVMNAAAVRDLIKNPEAAPSWLSGSATTATSNYNWSSVLTWTSPAGHSLIEYIDPTETENFYIAMKAEDLDNDHTHMEIHPCTMLGTMASNIPFPDHNQAPRNSYQSAMGKQAMGVYALNYRERMDTMSNLLWYSSVPLASPYMSRFYRAQAMPSGFNIVVAIMTYGGYNQEDSIMINRSALDRGLFRSEFYRTYKDEEKKNQASGEEERFCRPSPATTRHMKLANYGKLGPDGIVPENTYVTQDDVLIGKVAPIRLRGADGAAMAGINHAALQAMSSVAAAQAVEAAGGKRFRDSSKLMRTNESGYVDRIYRGRNGEGYSFVKIRVREERVPVIGDKFSSRHGQKGTCGLILAPEDMPQTASGIIPDIIINPHCIPSRMTIAQLMETLLGRLGCEEGFLGDATPFNTAMTAAGLADELQKRGLEPYSNEVLYCGYTGKQLATNIFMGPCFYQRLKHMVADKIHSRATGPLVMLTRQPAEGRARDGGLRFGEMERDCMIAHGASAFLKERMMEASDNFEVHVCKGCGLIGVANKARNIWNCTGCGNTTEFSQVRIPYAYKLFLQELESMNISSRILPETRLRALTDAGVGSRT